MQRDIPKGGQSASQLLSLIRVAKSVTCSTSSPREAFLEDSALHSTNNQLLNCLIDSPLHHYFSTTGVVASSSIGPILILQNARLILYRHNLTPMAPDASRDEAIIRCSEVAQQTAQIISRSMRSTTTDQVSWTPWEDSLPRIMCTIWYTHLLRCTLFLVLRDDYAAAQICIRASAALRSTLPISRACRQYLQFFLHYLGHKLPSDASSRWELDEDLIAYLSADLQRGDASWIFRGNDVSILRQNDSQQACVDTSSRHQVQGETQESSWAGIVEQLEKLEANRSKLLDQDEETRSSGPLRSSHQLIPPVPASAHIQNPGGTSRMNIADILGKT